MDAKSARFAVGEAAAVAPKEPAERAWRDTTALAVILYDGDCGVCQGFVRFVLRADPRAHFAFAPLRGDFAAGVLARHVSAAGAATPDSVVLVDRADEGTRERLRFRSDAVLAIGSELTAPWRFISILFGALPRRWRDAVYDAVARRRGRWRRAGTATAACAVPTPSERARFLP